MRDITSIETPNLFSPELVTDPGAGSTNARDEKQSTQMARDFVRWCWSFGSDFRNSPDITNLRSWQRKNQMPASAFEDDEILAEARRLFLKKMEQAVRKSDVRKEAD